MIFFLKLEIEDGQIQTYFNEFDIYGYTKQCAPFIGLLFLAIFLLLSIFVVFKRK